MGILEALILGIVQGLTEFLPVSSSGHLALGQILLGKGDAEAGLAFSVAVHVGSLAAVLFFVRHRIKAMLTTHPRLIVVLAAATLPLAFAIPLRDVVKSLSESPVAVGGLLIGTAGILFYVRKSDGGERVAHELTWGRAAAIGFAQLLGILPGISRSGATISAGLKVGLTRDDAVQFSFLMAIPAIAGAFLFEMLKGSFGKVDIAPILVGGGASFVASLVAMKVMVGVVQRKRLGWFALYCLLAGLTAIVAGTIKG